MNDNVISVKNVTKTYRLYNTHADRVKEAFHPLRKKYHRPFNALEDVSFDIKRGEPIGIIGRNGSGKSTLLQIICGILQPTLGNVEVDGRVSALLELGAGFNPEFTGRENVYINGAILGLKRGDIDARFDDIARFADIGDFIDQPVKTYSSGMYVRLAFAVAINVDPDILVVDEALAVGDIYFQHKCMHRMSELLKGGTTVVFVTHDMTAVKSLCTEAILLHDGSIAKRGRAEEVVDGYYRQMILEEQRKDEVPLPEEAEENRTVEVLSTGHAGGVFRRDEEFIARTRDMRSGTGEVRIQNVELLDDRGNAVLRYGFGEVVVLRVHLEFFSDCEMTNVGFLVRDKNGVEVIGTNLSVEDGCLEKKKTGDVLVIDFRFRNILRNGTYSVACAVGKSDDQGRYNVSTYDWVDNAKVFTAEPRAGKPIHAQVCVSVEIEVKN
jgi:lipopolysaccharide transport system ATP-binding protein